MELWQTLRADIIDMEGAAVVQVGRQLGTPVLVIRSISDIDEHVGTDWETYFRISVQNAAQVVIEVIAPAKWAG